MIRLRTVRVATIPKSRFMVWLRTWNPRWFVNPFYSPSVDYYLKIEKIFKAFCDGFEKGLRSNKGDEQ